MCYETSQANIYHIIQSYNKQFYFAAKMTSPQPKKKASRATQDQLARMVAFFYENPGLAEGKFSAMQGKLAATEKWQELAQELNLMGGGNKRYEQWQVVSNEF